MFLPTNANNSYLVQILREFMSFSGMYQCNNIFNANKRILDLILCSERCIVSSSDFPLTSEDPHHKALQFELRLTYMHTLKPAPCKVYCFYNANYQEINNELCAIDWCNIFSPLSLEECILEFYKILNNLINKFVPQRPLRSSHHKPPWYTKPLRRLLNTKQKYHKLWKTYKNPLDFECFKSLRKRAIQLEKKCYDSYINNIEEKIHKQPKCFWSYIKSTISKTALPHLMYYKGRSSSNGEQICDFFNEHFYSVFENSTINSFNLSEIPLANNTIFNINSIHISKEIVYKYLKSVNVAKGAGPDGIHPVLIRNCATNLALPITILFMKSFREGRVPAIWKMALVTPIPKGDISQFIDMFNRFLKKP
ncbi:uncharacterized protein LOC126977139 [Leptidea sinapis]|uniref:uncharacterized protein LOC126977139 n=1 Tax=Leptidea sinapis TaxID=189913 RepID=UPI0021C2DEF2|nr:uncharacterized protein LOC126977139 [Leptidea sinapis]